MQTQINRWLTSLHIPLVGAATNVDLRGAAGVSLATFVILNFPEAAIAQLGERQTEDLKVPGSIPGLGMDNVKAQCRTRSRPQAVHWLGHLTAPFGWGGRGCTNRAPISFDFRVPPACLDRAFAFVSRLQSDIQLLMKKSKYLGFLRIRHYTCKIHYEPR